MYCNGASLSDIFILYICVVHDADIHAHVDVCRCVCLETISFICLAQSLSTLFMSQGLSVNSELASVISLATMFDIGIPFLYLPRDG